ncbi:hypothetical protein BU23DRAFT_458133, partial [Bimuria novae-zelandiae CBS 107.79]
RLIVCCPPGYYQRGNIQYLCRKDNVPLFNDFDELIKAAITRLKDIMGENLLV